MGWQATLRAIEAAERRQQRELKRRQRELEHRAKQQAKLSELERARLEVETFDDRIHELLSLHREQGDVVDWEEFAASLPPPDPQRRSYYELRTRQYLLVSLPNATENPEIQIEQAQAKDEQLFQEEVRTFSAQKAKWVKLKDLSRRVLAGEHKAYIEALVEFNPFSELSDLGSSIHFIVHNAKLIECVLTINGKQAIPSEVKTITPTGKLSIKSMPKDRFYAIYQNYLCSCVLRISREILSLLPVDSVLITASAELHNQDTGEVLEQPVLCLAIPRAVVIGLNFDELNSSNVLTHFEHRGDFTISRKSKNFAPITPLSPTNCQSIDHVSFDDLTKTIHGIRREIKSKLSEMSDIGTGMAQQNSVL